MVATANSLLIADDDDQIRWTLREIFEPVGFRIFMAATGEETLDLLDGNPVDCLLIDLHMPGLSGLETIQIVRQHGGSQPCILLTSDPSQIVLQRALALQIFTVLAKPVGKELVKATVRRAIKNNSRAS